MAAWLNANFTHAIVKLYTDHKEQTWDTIEPQSWNTFLSDIDTISTIVDQYPPLKQRVDRDTYDSIQHFRQEVKAEADEYNAKRRADTMVYSEAALKAWLEAHENVETSVGYQYFLVHELAPVRGELQGLRGVANATDGAAEGLNTCYIDDQRRIVIMIRDYKTMGTRIKAKPYVIPAELSAHLIPRLEEKGMLFPKNAAKMAGDMFRNKGIAFPFGPGQKRFDDVTGFRHTLATYRNCNLFKGPETMRGTHLATLMLHTRKASETTYRHGQVFLHVPGFNDDGTPSLGAAGASTSGTAAPRRRAPKAPRPPTVAPPKPRAPRPPPRARGA